MKTKTKTIKQSILFKARPDELYELIMDAKKHKGFTGGSVKMSRKINGKFEVFEGYCTGYNIELEENKKIVQAWHFQEDGWPDDHYSVCTFLFETVANGTKLIFTQSGVPEHKFQALKEGWKQYYWEPMKKYLLQP